MGSSYQGANTSDLYGVYNVGLQPEPTYKDLENRAACVQFRCPGMVNDGGSIKYGVQTKLEVRMNPKPNSTCKFQ